MNRSIPIKCSVVVAITLMAIVFSGCVSAEKKREREAEQRAAYLKAEKEEREQFVRNAEPIPPDLAEEAKTYFTKGVPFFIWRSKNEDSPHSAAHLKIHYAISPHVTLETLEVPIIKALGREGRFSSMARGATLDFSKLRGKGRLMVYFDSKFSIPAGFVFVKPESNIIVVDIYRK
ncbi:MAG: hypothetical protein JXA41_11845 [Deltaproteobacteria bacterium]|nr:hypothetical protein [Deltaproteobacteria bacterium]